MALEEKSVAGEDNAAGSRTPGAGLRGFFGTSIGGGVRSAVAVQEIGVLGALAVLWIALTISRPNFISPSNLLVVFQQASYFGIMALGMVLVLSEGDIDLSVGSVVAFSMVVSGQFMANGTNPWLAGVLGLLVGAVCGMTNGILSVILRIPTFVVTLGTLSAYRGLALVVSNGQSIAIINTNNSFFNVAGGGIDIGKGANTVTIPAIVIVMLVLCVMATIVYRRTPLGRRICAVGSNRQAALFAGIHISRLRILVMTVMGTLASLVGVLTVAYLQNAGPTFGQGDELGVIAAAIVGGSALTGGSGTMPGALIGAVIIATISNGLLLLGVNQFWSTFASGAIIIAAVALDYLFKRR